MAETILTAAELSAIERDLDDLRMPAFETVRRLIDDVRTLRKSGTANAPENVRLTAALDRVRTIADQALKEAS